MIHLDVRHAFRIGVMILLVLSAWAHAEVTSGGGGGESVTDPSVLGALLEELGDARRLETLHAAAVRFYDGGAAREAGFVRCPDCVDDTARPGRVRLVDGGSADVVGVALEEPRHLVYEARPNGDLRLIGLEYVVPVDAWYDAGFDAPPTLFGRAFAHTDAVLGEPAYVLFVPMELAVPERGFSD